MAGPDGTAQPGQVIRLPNAKAKALVDGGYASYSEVEAATPVVETAESKVAPENATAPPGDEGREREPANPGEPNPASSESTNGDDSGEGDPSDSE